MRTNASKISNYFFIAAVFVAIFLWSTVWRNAQADVTDQGARITFIDVGEGDAALVVLPGEKEILIDTGKPGKLNDKIKSKMPAFDNKIEAVFFVASG